MTTGTLLREAIARATGCDAREVGAPRRVAGGDVSRAAVVDVAGQRAFVKHLDPAVPGLLGAEAAGLRWLAEANAIRVPAVLGVLDGPDERLPVLVLEHVASTRPAPDFSQRLGRSLAALHRAGADAFGAPWPGFVGPIAQPNEPTGTWAALLARRLRVTAAAAERRGALPAGTGRALDGLLGRLADLLGPPEPPARLHGDLWSGNVMAGPRGEPVLVDPAALGGHREVDLAMLALFGGDPNTVTAYEVAFPLADGWRDRVALHQLHPLLVHAVLFGGGYGLRARAVIDRYA